ncbi:hypothetical protein Tco_0948740 [Tanacetum coccineum]
MRLKTSGIESTYSRKALNCHIKNVNVNTKFLNAFQPEWSKFVTDVELAKNLYTTNYDQRYAYLNQHEGHLSSTPQPTHSSQSYVPTYEAPHHQQQYQHAFQSQLSLTTPSIPQSDDVIACQNKAMAFVSTVMASHFPSTNNQLRTSSNPRNHATIQDGRVTVQQAHESGQVLDEEQLAFLADLRIADGQATWTKLPQNAAFQTDDLDAYDSDCNDISSAKAF